MKKYFWILILIFLFGLSIYKGFLTMEYHWTITEDYGIVDSYKVLDSDFSNSKFVFEISENGQDYIIVIQNHKVMNKFEV